MTPEEIGKINSLTSDWIYHEQEIRRIQDSNKYSEYHRSQQLKDEKFLLEIMKEIVKRDN